MAKLSAELISTDLLKNHAGMEIFHQGQLLFRWGRVIIDKVLEDRAFCRVNNSRPFLVEINFLGLSLIISLLCEIIRLYEMNQINCNFYIAILLCLYGRYIYTCSIL